MPSAEVRWPSETATSIRSRQPGHQVRTVPVPPSMATTPEHRTIAPIVGPDDPRHFTDSGIEVERLYTEEEIPSDLPERLGEPHRDVRRVIAAGLLGRTLDLDGYGTRRIAPSAGVARRQDPRGNRVADQVARRVGHRAESAGSIAAASPRGSCARKNVTRSAAAMRYETTSVARFAV